MRALALLLVTAAAGCTGGRASTADGAAYLDRLGRLYSVADSTGAVEVWARLASVAARPPNRLSRAEREAGCSFAQRADSQLRGLLHTDDLNIRGYNVAFWLDGAYIAQPDSTWEAAEEALGCQRSGR